MSNNKTITINGRKYDSVTGLPVKGVADTTIKPAAKTTAKATAKPAAKAATKVAKEKPKTAASRSSLKATAVHSTTERSKTLRRSATKKPVGAAKTATKHPTRGRTMDIARSSRVAKFAPHPEMKSITSPKFVKKPTTTKVELPKSIPKKTAPAKATATKTKDEVAKTHPLAQRAAQRKAASKPKTATPKAPSGKQEKEAAINKALAATPKKTRKKRKMATWKKRFIIGTICVAVLIGGGLAVYWLIPNVSVSIAAAQAGVRASYPEYTPDGFRLHHPVTYSEGEVVLTFASNGNSDTYTISQTKSSWDSTAVLDNVVRAAVGENYVTTQERGLTIYTYDTNATWVNGGVLYTITSDAHLSNEQIRRIATSI